MTPSEEDEIQELTSDTLGALGAQLASAVGTPSHAASAPTPIPTHVTWNFVEGAGGNSMGIPCQGP